MTTFPEKVEGEPLQCLPRLAVDHLVPALEIACVSAGERRLSSRREARPPSELLRWSASGRWIIAHVPDEGPLGSATTGCAPVDDLSSGTASWSAVSPSRTGFRER